jgi:hypothetical protein
MHWMEMITLRTLERQGKDGEIADLLCDLIKQMEHKNGLVETKVLSCASFRGDLALSLTWDTPLPERNGSRLGLSIAKTLKTFGLVDHTIWTEESSYAGLLKGIGHMATGPYKQDQKKH